MRKYIFSLFFLVANLTYGQVIDRIEYFFNTDPGYGNGQQIELTADSIINDFTFSAGITQLNPGIHTFFVRVHQSDGKWSVVNHKVFLRERIEGIGNIVQLEYFIDEDPGYDMATKIALNPQADIQSKDLTFDITTTEPGIHTLFVRAMDSEGSWSVVNQKVFFRERVEGIGNIVQLEYFIDEDPGYGLATKIVLNPQADIQSKDLTFDISTIEPGIHTLFVRALNTEGSWSVVNQKVFLRERFEGISNIVQLEYFIDEDPGFGMAESLTLIPQPDIQNLEQTIDLSGTAPGSHTINFRALDAKGYWSLINSRIFRICSPSEQTSAEIFVSSCNYYELNGIVYESSGIYIQNLINTAGCDSTISLNLTITEPTNGTDVQIACGSFTWIDGNTYTESNNTETFVLVNAAGCDSVVTLNLTILQPTEKIMNETACESFTLNGATYSASGIYVQHLTNAVGCDSTLTLHLTITEPTNGTDVQTVCSSFTWIDGNSYTESNNTATFTLANTAGCDSVVTLNLTILQPTENTITETACESLVLNGETYTTSGTYIQHLTNVAGCDSTIILNLTLTEPTSGTDVQTACSSFTWIDGNTYTESNNTAIFTLTNTAGCDSVVTLNLTILQPTENTIAETACESFTLNGETYTTSGTYIQHLTNVAGCDSTLTLHLTINETTSGTDVQTACSSFTWIDGNTYTEDNNSATFTLTNADGCDSVVTLNLTIINLDASISQDNTVLTAIPSGAVYQWIDCIGNNPIAGATDQNFAPMVSGQYAVIVDTENCTDTSECFAITITSAEVNEPGAIKIYPNPVIDFLMIEGIEKITTIEVYDVFGKKVKVLTTPDPEKPVIDMQALEQGVYFIKIYNLSGFSIWSVMKQ